MVCLLSKVLLKLLDQTKETILITALDPLDGTHLVAVRGLIH